MLKFLVRWSVHNRVLMALLAAAFLVLGIQNARQARLDVLPDFAPPQVVVQTEAPGLSPEQVELLVTRPVEAALLGAAAAEAVRSESIQGLSVVTVVFRDDVDPWRARQIIGELLVTVGTRLPAGVGAPQATPLTSATMDLLKIGLLSERLTVRELRALAEWTVLPRLQAVPGVAGVHVFGGELPRLEVRVRDVELAARGLTFADIEAATRSASGLRPAGFVDSRSQRIVVQSDGQAVTPAQLGETLLTRPDGQQLRLADVADVVEGGEPRFGDCLIQGRPGVLLTLLGQYGTNTLEQTQAVEAALADLTPALTAAGVELLPRLHRPATFIENALGNLDHSLWIGAALVAVVLVLFLRDLRTVAISLLAIPLSLLGAVMVLGALGYGIDTMALGGLAMAIGEVVDDAIIDVENVVRRLALARDTGQKPWRTVVLASLEVRSAVVHATLIVALAFVPVLVLPGLTGRLFAPLGVAYLVAVLCSLAVALLVTPALCLLLFARRAPQPPGVPTAAVQARLLRTATRHLGALLLAMAALVGGSVWSWTQLSVEFLPQFREGHFVLQLIAAPGTSLDEMRRLGGIVSNELLRDPRIATVEQQIGRSELGEDTWGPNRSEFHVELQPIPGAQMDDVEHGIRAVLDGIPAVQTEVLTFLGDRISESVSGEATHVVVTIYGDDLDALGRAAQQTARALAAVPGAVDVRIGAEPGMPGYEVRLRRDRLTALGFTADEVLADVEIALQGRTVGQVFVGMRTTNVAVVLDPELRRAPEQIGDLTLRSQSGTIARLGDLAFVEPRANRSVILHEGGRRRQTVTCNARGRDVASVVHDAEQRVANDVLLPPPGYLVFAGAAAEAATARGDLLLHTGLCALVGLLILGAAAGNLPNLLLLLSNLPFAFVGGVWLLWATGTSLSMGATVGFVTLFGITVRNSIMLLSHFRHLVAVEGQPWNDATCARGAAERARPILMTALVTGLGLLPIALGRAEAGREIEGPMALVILG
ncbi:MAG: efflux RND transporter permease subunit, partial [Planctomycetes bacterium]|nr:efflux RND transporter permease subunit [Planctomycetota bacterium]